MSPSASVFAFALACVAIALPARAQNGGSVQTVKELYAAAAYEDALALVSRVESERPEPELEQYRAFCLIALGRSREAQSAIERLMAVDPLFVPDPNEISPRMQAAFSQERQRLLPAVTKRVYADAKAALERKDREAAVVGFEKLLGIIDTASPAPESLAEMRLLASGFLDLSRALPDTSARNDVRGTAPTAEATPATTPAKPSDVTRAVAIKQALPPWVPSDPLSLQRGFDGSVRVHIGADGRVDAAAMVKPVHPAYDPVLLRAAREWIYEPAKANGLPVPSELIIQVQLRPRP